MLPPNADPINAVNSHRISSVDRQLFFQDFQQSWKRSADRDREPKRDGGWSVVILSPLVVMLTQYGSIGNTRRTRTANAKRMIPTLLIHGTGPANGREGPSEKSAKRTTPSLLPPETGTMHRRERSGENPAKGTVLSLHIPGTGTTHRQERSGENPAKRATLNPLIPGTGPANGRK